MCEKGEVDIDLICSGLFAKNLLQQSMFVLSGSEVSILTFNHGPNSLDFYQETQKEMDLLFIW